MPCFEIDGNCLAWTRFLRVGRECFEGFGGVGRRVKDGRVCCYVCGGDLGQSISVCRVIAYLYLLAARLIFVLELVCLLLDLGKGHGERVGSINVFIVFWDVEGEANGFGKVIIDDASPIGEYLVGRWRCHCRGKPSL